MPKKEKDQKLNTALSQSRLERMVRLIATSAHSAYRNVLSGGNSKAQQHYFDTVGEPQVGDCVVEISSLGWKLREGKSLIDQVGELKSIVGGKYGKYEIETLDGRTVTWDNAEFIVVPDNSYSGRWTL